jgi:hypothetical protein
VKGLLDTGASCSAVDPSYFRRLGLVPTGSTQIHTPSTGPSYVTRDQYDVCLILGDSHAHPLIMVLPVIGSDLASEGIDVLIGRDVLMHCLFVFVGTKGEFTLTF